MFQYIKKGVGFIRKNPTILYSFLLMVLIPLAFYYNTFFAIRSFQKNIDYNLQTKALLAENIFGSLASETIKDPAVLNEKIKEIARQNPEIVKIQVILPEDEKFKIIASKDSQEVGKNISSTSIDLAWSQDQAIAHLVSKNGERFWIVAKPFYDSANKKAGLVAISMSLKEADYLILNIIRSSYFILIMTILLSLFLISHHTYLFKYRVLLSRLQEIDKMKDSFIRMATHELQGPIVNIRNYISALEEETKNSLTEEQKELVKVAKISANNLINLVYDILEVSRIEQARLDFTPKAISPAEEIKGIVEELRGKAEGKKLFLRLEVKSNGRFIKVNPNRFRQIIVNLIENAIKYTLKGGVTITTRVDEAAKRYIIEVRDTGIGIPAEAQKRLFERFYRVKTAKTAGIPGTGLGLWISKQLCERMKGKIFVESMEGVGTKFTVIFPLSS